MKKVILAMVLILPFVFQSCKDDDDTNSLVGTTWLYSYTEDGELTKVYLKFIDEKNVEMSVSIDFDGGVVTSDPMKGTYVVSGSNIELDFPDADDIISGTINGNRMTLYDRESSSSIVFVKQ